ncbi:MAG TPA: thiamine-binding protein [Cyclobacteriaceae bacterium]|jgi:uncharacterized protein YqgV (UPF0045/DUF77 family)
MNHTIHLAIQIVPLVSRQQAYGLIDKAIEAIAATGLPYSVGPMETVLEGTYDEVLSAARKAQQACLDAGADELVVNIKLHVRKNGDVTMDEKLAKYS